jgi:hypothetical protein
VLVAVPQTYWLPPLIVRAYSLELQEVPIGILFLALNKNRPVFRTVFLFHKPALLFSAAEPP